MGGAARQPELKWAKAALAERAKPLAQIPCFRSLVTNKGIIDYHYIMKIYLRKDIFNKCFTKKFKMYLCLLNVLIKAGGSHIGNKTMKYLLLADIVQPVPHSAAY